MEICELENDYSFVLGLSSIVCKLKVDSIRKKTHFLSQMDDLLHVMGFRQFQKEWNSASSTILYDS